MEGDKLQAIRVVVRVRPFLGDEVRRQDCSISRRMVLTIVSFSQTQAQRHKRCVLPDSANASVTVKR